MTETYDFQYFQGNSFSDLYAQDLTDARYGFILNYPATASWAVYPNSKKYYIQDGSDEATKTPYQKISQQEPWKNLAVLGDVIPGIVIRSPRNLLVEYWQEHFGFNYSNMEVMQRSVYLDYLNQTDRFEKLITLFPFDHLHPEKHAVDPETHYRLLSKVTLNQSGASCPTYKSYNLHQTPLQQIPLPEQFPYLIKTSHGLSGEGTYIIRNNRDLDYCLREIEKYLEIQLLDTIVVSEFIQNTVQNYCVQFYVNKSGEITLIGATRQLVSPEGGYLGGVIQYRDIQMNKFFEMIAALGQYAHQHGYFGVVGFDVLETQEGKLYVIDANFRVNGSTPLCLQRHTLLERGKEVAKYSSDYQMDGTLDSILETLQPELERKDFMILSALEKVKYGKIYTALYGIVTGETIADMQRKEKELRQKGLQLFS